MSRSAICGVAVMGEGAAFRWCKVTRAFVRSDAQSRIRFDPFFPFQMKQKPVGTSA